MEKCLSLELFLSIIHCHVEICFCHGLVTSDVDERCHPPRKVSARLRMEEKLTMTRVEGIVLGEVSEEIKRAWTALTPY